MGWLRKKVDHAEMTLEVPQIIGKERPRSSSKDGEFHTYTPIRTIKAEKYIARAFRMKYGNQFCGYTEEVRVHVTYWRCLAKSNPKFWAGRADLGKPDADNVLKLVLDALNHVAYADDSNITYESVRKMPRIPFIKGNHLRVQIDYYTERFEKEK